MAVELVTTIKKWQGASTDTKPSADVPAGSLFYETDTKSVYVYAGGAWVLAGANVMWN